jgi:hypothetical protein
LKVYTFFLALLLFFTMAKPFDRRIILNNQLIGGLCLAFGANQLFKGVMLTLPVVYWDSRVAMLKFASVGLDQTAYHEALTHRAQYNGTQAGLELLSGIVGVLAAHRLLKN